MTVLSKISDESFKLIYKSIIYSYKIKIETHNSIHTERYLKNTHSLKNKVTSPDQ